YVRAIVLAAHPVSGCALSPSWLNSAEALHECRRNCSPGAQPLVQWLAAQIDFLHTPFRAAYNKRPFDLMSVALWFVLALLTTLLLVPACRAVAIRRRFVAEPRADRWHRRTVALFGGVAVALTVFGGS